MKMKRIKALLLSVLMLCSMAIFCACGGGDTTGATNDNTEGSGTENSGSNTVSYSVAVEDALGNPYTEGIVVLFFQNGEQVAMQSVNAEGVATKELEPGDYTVELMITDGTEYHYEKDNLTLSASVTQLRIEMARPADEEVEYLFADEEEHEAPYLSTGCTYVELEAGVRNYFVFVPLASGIYEFTVHHAEGTIGCYGSPFFVLSESTGTVAGEQSMTVEIKDSMIGSGDGGSTVLVIGVDAGSNTESCVLSVVRIGDCVLSPEEMPWTVYEPTFTPGKYTLPEGATISEFDLTAEYTLVFNETDGYYHLNAADGPVVLVRMVSEPNFGVSFGAILAGANVGKYYYDENGTFVKKVLFNDCLMNYLGTLNKGMGTYSYSDGMLDDTYEVYPLTKDLAYILQEFGAYKGWYQTGHAEYLFGSLPNVNLDIAWLFMCCYAE